MSLNIVNPFKAFLPTTISNLEAWYDAADNSTITEVGNRVSQWNDKSGNGNDLVQPVAGEQPLLVTNAQNGLDLLDFSTQRNMETNVAWSALLQPYTLTCIVRIPNNTAQGALILQKSGDVVDFLRNRAGTNDRYRWNAGAEIAFTEVGFKGTIVQITCIADGASSVIRFNGIQKVLGDTGSGTFAGLIMAGNSPDGFWDDEIFELCVYDKALNADEVAAIEGYFNDKWLP